MRKYRNATNHSKENHRLFSIRRGMILRCYNSDSPRYKDYGGRGISICNEWLDDFDNFADWAKDNGYELGLTIDRIDNNGNYEPLNCRWVTKREQNRNKRTNLMVTYNGETKPLIEWCEELGLRYDPIHNRIVNGWNIDDAFNTPLASECESFASICRRHNINQATVRDRMVKFGWSLEDALNTPSQGRGVRPRPIDYGVSKCRVCGKEFSKNNSKQIYCGEKCRSISKRKSYRQTGLVIDGRSSVLMRGVS